MLTAIRLRLRAGAALRIAAPAAGFAAFAWISVRFAVAAGLLGPSSLVPLAAALVASVVLLGVAAAGLVRAPDAALVRELDRRAGARGRVIAGFELSGREDPFSRASVADAQAAIADASARAGALFPVAMPASLSRVLLLLLLAPAAQWALTDAHWTIARAVPRSVAVAEASLAETGAPPAAAPVLPTSEWVVREVRAILAPLASPTVAPPPPAVVLAPTPPPPRGASIVDPEKRAFFERVLDGANDDTVAQQIGQAFTHELASEALQAIEAQVIANTASAGAKYQPGGVGKTMSDPPMPKGAGGGIAPVVDPKKMKSEYMKDRDQGSELAAAIKESFDDYLKQFSTDLLKGMEDALEAKLAGKSTAVSPRALPQSPDGMADEAPSGPAFAAKSAEGGAPTSAGALSAQASGGTQAGGVGAGAGGKDGVQTAAPNGALADASGSRVDLHGTLGERLAVVEVVRRMSGGSEQIEDTASAEVVAKSTKAAEAAAANSEEIPPEYRGAVEQYFRALSGKKNK